MNLWLTMIAIGIATFAIRLSFIYLFGKVEMPDLVKKALRYVPPAVLERDCLPRAAFAGRAVRSLVWQWTLDCGSPGSGGRLAHEERCADDRYRYGSAVYSDGFGSINWRHLERSTSYFLYGAR